MIFRACSCVEEILKKAKAAECCAGFWLADQSQAAVVQRAGSGLKCHLSHEYKEPSLQNEVQEGTKWRTSGMVSPNFLNHFSHLQLIPPPQRTLPWELVPHTGNHENILTWKYFITQNEGVLVLWCIVNAAAGFIFLILASRCCSCIVLQIIKEFLNCTIKLWSLLLKETETQIVCQIKFLPLRVSKSNQLLVLCLKNHTQVWNCWIFLENTFPMFWHPPLSRGIAVHQPNVSCSILETAVQTHTSRLLFLFTSIKFEICSDSFSSQLIYSTSRTELVGTPNVSFISLLTSLIKFSVSREL